jgi:hypothetical protein
MKRCFDAGKILAEAGRAETQYTAEGTFLSFLTLAEGARQLNTKAGCHRRFGHAVSSGHAGRRRLSHFQSFPFASGINHSRWLIVGGMLECDGRPQWTFFLVGPNDFKILDTWFTVAMCATGRNTAVCDDVYVPESHVLALTEVREGKTPILRILEVFVCLSGRHARADVYPKIGQAHLRDTRSSLKQHDVATAWHLFERRE